MVVYGIGVRYYLHLGMMMVFGNVDGILCLPFGHIDAVLDVDAILGVLGYIQGVSNVLNTALG